MVNMEEEWPQILSIGLLYGIDPFFLAAIRKAEGGGPGREFGIISVSAPTYRQQLELCAESIRNNLVRCTGNLFEYNKTKLHVKRIVYSIVFIEYMARRYAPIAAENDPEGLNKNWVNNVRSCYLKYASSGWDGLGGWKETFMV